MNEAVEVGSFARAEIQRHKYFRQGWGARSVSWSGYGRNRFVAPEAGPGWPALPSGDQEERLGGPRLGGRTQR